MSLNRFQFIGNIARESEVKDTPGGRSGSPVVDE